MRKTVAIAIALIGLGLGIAVLVWLGASKTFHAIVAIGWRGISIVVLWQLAVFGLLGVAWWLLSPGVSVWIVYWGRLVRQAGEKCLPFSEIGGLVLGARALMLGGAPFAAAAASSVVDIATEAIALAPFLLFGLVVLAHTSHSPLLLPMGIGLAILVASGGLAFLLRNQLARLLRLGVTWLLRNWTRHAPECADELEWTLQQLFHQRWRIVGASAMHLFAWFGGGGSIWIAYHLLGAHVSVVDALAIEGMLSAALSVGFLVPSGLGVQEVSYIGLGAAFGLAPQVSLSLSLIRRARDLIIGVPVLALWEILEARRLRRK
ncbi:MAG: flippase-like domain-containing protein [Sinobacteraceae bacterium]|nr:flippase-like domain-containing protein [Nevskiaceae bacterium]